MACSSLFLLECHVTNATCQIFILIASWLSLFSNKQLKYPNIIAVACSDRGAGNDPETFRLVLIKDYLC